MHRAFKLSTIFVIAVCLLSLANQQQLRADDKAAAKPLKIHMIAAAAEYDSKGSLAAFAKLLEKDYNVSCTLSAGGPDFADKLDNLEKLPEADLMIVFSRRMKLSEEQMKPIRQHWEQGKPIMGIRTACHAFQKDDNEIFDRKVLGGNYQNHFKAEPVKVTNTVDQAKHPILNGVEPFKSDKLYKMGDLATDTVVLQMGEIKQAKMPVTMVHTYNKGRVFFTSLGTQEDFKDANFLRLITNAVFWTTERDAAKLKK